MDFSHGGNPGQIGRRYGIPPENLLDFSANINPLGPPPSARRAIEESFRLLPKYPDIEAKELRQAIAGYEGVATEYVFPCNGAAEGLFQLVREIAPKRAAIFCPAFSEYREACHAAGCEVLSIILDSANGFAYDDTLLNRIPEGIDLLFLCTPSNPTGAVAPPSFLASLLKLSKEREFRLLIDESFLDFRRDADSLSVVSFCREYPGLIVLKSLTKLFALAGARIGYALSSDISLLRRTKEASPPWTINVFAERLAVCALQEREYIESTRSFIELEGQYLYQKLLDIPSLRPFLPGANFILFQTEKTLPLQRLLLAENILIRECASFEGLDETYFRVCISQRENNVRLLEALRRFCAEKNGLSRYNK